MASVLQTAWGGGHKHLCVGVTSSPSCHFLDSWAPPSSSPTPTRGPLPTVPFAPCLLPSSWANTPASYSRSCHLQPVTCFRLIPSGSLLRCTSYFSKTSLTTSLETCWPGLAYLSLLCSLFCRAPVSFACFSCPGRFSSTIQTHKSSARVSCSLMNPQQT